MMIISSDPNPSHFFSILDTDALTQFLIENNIKSYPHVENIQRHLVQFASSLPISTDHSHFDDIDWSLIPNLPKRVVPLLTAHARFATEVAHCATSSDGNTTKLLLRLRRSGALIETVIMHYDRKDTHSIHQQPGPVATILTTDNDHDDMNITLPLKRNLKPRTAVCISSQVGCKMACTFCATGTMGFKDHLTSAEIAEQVFHANRVRKITSVIAMGMGEPFDNYHNLVSAIKIMTNRRVFSLGEGNICVSTVGVAPKVSQFMMDCPGVKLALSLHAPNQRLRNEIVPSARSYPLDKLIDAVDLYLSQNKRIMIEYILIRNVNISPEIAHELGQLLQNRSVILNLIPYNPTDVGQVYEAPLQEEIEQFDKILVQTYKIRTTIRRTMGQDIDGACGQLVVKASSNKNHITLDLEDLAHNKKAKNCNKMQSVLQKDNNCEQSGTSYVSDDIGRNVKRRTAARVTHHSASSPSRSVLLSLPNKPDQKITTNEKENDNDVSSIKKATSLNLPNLSLESSDLKKNSSSLPSLSPFSDIRRKLDQYMPVTLAALAGLLVVRVTWKLVTNP